MLDCKRTEELMIEAIYGELSEKESAQLETHLDICGDCQQAYADIHSTLGSMSKRERKDPGPVFWNNYWGNLAERMNEEAAGNAPTGIIIWFKSLISFNSWPARIIGAAAILVLGIWLGRGTQNNVKILPDQVSRSAVPAELASLNQRASNYMQRSKVLLLGLINFDTESEDTYSLNLPKQQQISQDLLTLTNDLKYDLNENANHKLKRLITDLELILLQIANLESEHDLEAIEMVKNGVDRRGILLKINLEEMKQASQPVQHRDNPPHAVI
ncbi:zf-HC2 domain-containing protein [bacterium]|nr:zf-HC2 domain-containing protein [bacterium]